MDRTERFYRIDQLLRSNACVPLTRFLDELEVSRATFKRDIEYLRSRLHAPIVWDRARNGYCFGGPASDAPRYALPGLWLTGGEIQALLTVEKLLEGIDPGLLAERLKPLQRRLGDLLGSSDHSAEEVRRRIRVLTVARRTMPAQLFEKAAGALLARRRLFIRYVARGTGEETQREVSPQRLVYYRDNWYLDAWCHVRKGLRSFSVDCIRAAEVLETPADEIDEPTLEAWLRSGYGIFSGPRIQWATLRFSPVAARWVASESWHPQQRGSFDTAGRYLLDLPYADDRELLRDILRFGAEVEVLAPENLRARVKDTLLEAARHYR